MLNINITNFRLTIYRQYTISTLLHGKRKSTFPILLTHSPSQISTTNDTTSSYLLISNYWYSLIKGLITFH